MGKKKLEIEFIRSEFEKEGYVLLTKEYINCKQKLGYICPEGHEHFIRWNDWQRGQRCPCFAGRPPINIKLIRSEFAKEGYQLLTKEYKNAYQKLDYICPKGHEHWISWNKWQQRKRCPYCAGNVRKDIDFIKKQFEFEGYELLTSNYINNEQKLKFICPNGHTHYITWAAWVSGVRCVYCSNRPPINIEFIRDSFVKDGYILLTDHYINAHQQLEYACPEGHGHLMTWNDWQRGIRCPTCAVINRSGENHYNWKGGISCEPYCDAWSDKEYKESILERDNHRCQNLDCWGTVPEDLTIHHIDYNKKNCGPENLITLCRSCNSRANYDREWHKDFYRIIMEKKYGSVNNKVALSNE